MKSFVIEGDLWLACQEGGFAADAFILKDSDEPQDVMYGIDLDNAVAKHFGADRIMPMGNRHIGSVCITIERIK